MARATHITTACPASNAGLDVHVLHINVIILVGSGLHEVHTT
jgi:hypothetical protein